MSKEISQAELIKEAEAKLVNGKKGTFKSNKGKRLIASGTDNEGTKCWELTFND